MPHYHLSRRGTYEPCEHFARGAFELPDGVAAEWDERVHWSVDGRPTNVHGLPLRPMPGGIYNGDAVEPGVFVDWQSDAVRLLCFTERRTSRAEQPTHRNLAERFGPFQHPLHPYRAADCQARRVDRGQARGGSARDPQAADYRRWSNRRWSPTDLAATAGSRFRRFGIEIEFLHTTDMTPARTAIARDATAAGFAFHGRYHTHNTDYALGGWQGMYDGSLSTGTEIVSPILDGSPASHDQVRDMLRIVRRHGGATAAGVGMHTNHDTTDFTTADKVRLIRNLRALAPCIAAFLPASRRTSSWARPLADFEWDAAEANIARGAACGIDRYRAFNLQHLHLRGDQCRVEWRQLGHTLNGRKVRAWVRMGQAVMAATLAGETFAVGTTVPQMVATLANHGMSQWAADFYLVRCGFAPLAAAA